MNAIEIGCIQWYSERYNSGNGWYTIHGLPAIMKTESGGKDRANVIIIKGVTNPSFCYMGECHF